MTNIDPDVFYSKEEARPILKARYQGCPRGRRRKRNYGRLQADIDSGHVWTLDGEGVGRICYRPCASGRCWPRLCLRTTTAPALGCRPTGRSHGVAMGSVEPENDIAALKAKYKQA